MSRCRVSSALIAMRAINYPSSTQGALNGVPPALRSLPRAWSSPPAAVGGRAG
jgi:hypothetical protein